MFWFFHEYLDEARRFRVNRVEAQSEQEARRLHRQACEFMWVTHHVEPSVSALFTKAQSAHRTIVQGHRPGDKYRTDFNPVPMPQELKDRFQSYASNES